MRGSRNLFALLPTMAMLLSSCGASPEPNPLPALTLVTPVTLTAGEDGVKLTADGAAFVPGSEVRWNGGGSTTSYVTDTHLVADIPATDLAVGSVVSVTVTNPGPGGGTSQTLYVTVFNAIPGLMELVPSRADAGGSAFLLTVNGDKFNANAEVHWNGTPRVTHFINASQLTAEITAADIAQPGTADVTVFTPGPGGGTSEVMVFMIGPASCDGPRNILLSSHTDGTEGNDRSDNDLIYSSYDGRFVAFSSYATNLVDDDTNGERDVFLRDTCIGATECIPTTTRISVASNGEQANGFSMNPRISSNGRYVVFISEAANLVPRLRNSIRHAYLRDTCFGEQNCTPSTTRISVGYEGEDQVMFSGGAAAPAVSADGRFLAFPSSFDNLIPNDTNGWPDVFLRDTCAGVSDCTPSMALVSVDNQGVQGNRSSGGYVSISGNGRYVYFGSGATNLVPGDLNGEGDVFVRDTCFGAEEPCSPSTSIVSLTAEGGQTDGYSGTAFTGYDGRFVTFVTRATNLVEGDTNEIEDAFLRDTCHGASDCVPSTVMISVDSEGNQAFPEHPDRTNNPGPAFISADNRFIAISTTAPYVADDTNRAYDVYVRDTCFGVSDCTPSLVRVTYDDQGQQLVFSAHGRGMSPNGRYVIFNSSIENVQGEIPEYPPHAFLGCVPEF